jgi:spermidine synthase
VGLAAGSLFAAKKLKQARGQTFLLLQLALTAYTVIFQMVIFREAQVGGSLAWLHDYFGSYNPLDLSSYGLGVLFSPEGELFRALYLGLALLMVFPPTFMMGVSFYSLQNAVQNDISMVSRKVGILQMCNILGGTLALLILGLWGLKHLGTFNALMVICALNQIFLPVFFYIEYKKDETAEMKDRCVKRCLLFAALSILPYTAMPNAHTMWSVLHGSKTEFDYEEDHTGIASVQTAYDEKYFVFVNGEGHSEIPFGSYHSKVGLVPLFLHDNPEDIAIIGLGAGDTCYSASSHKNTKSITCIEIIEAEPRVLKKHAKKTNYEPLKLLFNDPRIKFISGDGRRYIESCGQKFDIIQADALRPFTSRAGMLYSKEYFQAMKASLKPGGLLVTWLPTKRTYDTFRSVFPEHLNFGNTAIGSNQPITINTAQVLERYQQFCLHERVKATGHDGAQLVSQFLTTVLPNDCSEIKPENSNRDLFPRDEFLLPQLKN